MEQFVKQNAHRMHACIATWNKVGGATSTLNLHFYPDLQPFYFWQNSKNQSQV